MKTAVVIVAIVIGVAGYWLVSNSRAATETVDYTVVKADGRFEVRDYSEMKLVTAPMDEVGSNGSFGKLFRFISGDNEKSEKIAMTTPVLIDRGDKVETMSFIMPKAVAEKGVPKPSGAGVRLTNIAPSRFAVLRFSGGQKAENEARAIESLRAWVKSEKLDAKGEPVFAYYDPPWTPLFMRRNEVLIPVGK